MKKSKYDSLIADISRIIRENYENQRKSFEEHLKVEEVPQDLIDAFDNGAIEMNTKSLEDYLSSSDHWLLAGFRDGEQGREDFSMFLNLVRKQQEENKQLKGFIENNELDLLMEFKDYFPDGIK